MCTVKRRGLRPLCVRAGTCWHSALPSCIRSCLGCAGAVEECGGRGPHRGGRQNSVSEALCKVILNMQHHEYIYISTVWCVGFLWCSGRDEGWGKLGCTRREYKSLLGTRAGAVRVLGQGHLPQMGDV